VRRGQGHLAYRWSCKLGIDAQAAATLPHGLATWILT